MAKLKLNPDPTFSGKVDIHVPGKDPGTIVFTFKHRSRSELKSFLAKVKDMKDDVEMVMAMATGWDLEDEFSKANVKALLDEYIDAGTATFNRYLDELTGARSKN